MARYEVEVTETVTYRHTYVVETELDVEVDNAADQMHDANDRDDIQTAFEQNNVRVIEFIEDGSPESEFEVSDIGEIDE